MNTVSIRRFLTLIGLALAAISSMIAFAEPMPVPSAPAAEGRGTPSATLNFPADGGSLTPMQALEWSLVSATKYVVKMTVVETGEKLKYKANPLSICDLSDCSFNPASPNLFDRTKDGQTVKWKVVSKFVIDGVVMKGKSAARTFVVNEVETPVLTLPVDGVLLLPMHSLKWQNNAINSGYTLYIVNTTTGEKISTNLHAVFGCDAECAVNPYDLPGDLAPATTYEWYVKASGATGETAKSAVRTFVTP